MVDGVKPPFAYFGGKTRLAPWITALMPPHRVYVEPFCGSAAVLFQKPASQHEVINDAAGSVVNFFRVLRDQPAELEYAVSLSPFARDEFEACADFDDMSLDPVERARRWWVRSTQGFSQSATGTGWSISTSQNVNRPHQLVTRIERFAAAAERLRPVFIENIDALTCIEKYGADDAVFYVDPPYLDVTRSAFNHPVHGRRRPAGDYECEFNTEADHRALAETLKASPATVLLSGYPSELYDELYADWHQVSRQVLVHASHDPTAARARKTEVIWSNRPFADARLFDVAVVAS